MKRVLAVIALALAVSGCSSRHQPEPGATAPSVAPASVATTPRPQLPALEPRLTVLGDRVPWGRVGRGWQLVTTVRGIDADGGLAPTEARVRLLGANGGRFDLALMDRDVLADSRARRGTWPFPTVEDVSAVDRTVLLLFHDTARDATAVSLDLVTGEQQQARVPMGTAALMLRPGGFAYLDARQRLVAAAWDGPTDPIARAVNGVLPLADRSEVVAPDPLRVVGFDGSTRPLTEPVDEDRCTPRSWWDADAVVLSCAGGSLWSVPLDGSAAREIVAEGEGTEYGIDDAVTLGAETYVQKLEGCGGGWLARARPGGSTTDLAGTRGWRLVDATRDRLVVRPATTCGELGRHVGLALLDPHTLVVAPLLTLAKDEVLWSVRSWDGLPEPVS